MSTEPEQRHLKRRRDHYTRRACDGCKIRKVKCSGMMPCSRCFDVHGECVYSDLYAIERNKVEDMQQMPDRLQDLERFVRLVQDGLSQLAPTTAATRLGATGASQRMPPTPSPESTAGVPSTNQRLSMRRHQSSTSPYTTLSSFETMLRLAQSSMAENAVFPSINTEVFSVTPAADQAAPESASALIQAGKSILALGQTIADSLVHAYASQVGVLYPCVDIATVRKNLRELFQLTSHPRLEATLPIALIDIEIIKAVLAVSACSNTSEPSTLAQTLEQSLLWSTESVYSQELASIEDVIMSCLLCILFFQRDERQRAWRMAGFGARLSLELGLHVHEPHEPHEPLMAVSDVKRSGPYHQCRSLLFCCVHDLDSWTGFVTGLPCVLSSHLQSDHLSCLAPQPYRFLRAMIEMDTLGRDIVALLKDPDQMGDSLGTRMDFLEFRLKGVETFEAEGQDCAIPKIVQLHIRLRANHLRIVANLRLLSSVSMIATRSRSFESLVLASVANVWVCKVAPESGPIPAVLRATFIHFLIAAVSSMVLAAKYNPKRYGDMCRRPFTAGLETLETWIQESRGIDPQRRYSLANLRKLGQTTGISYQEPSDPSWSHGDSGFASNTNGALQDLSSGANFEQSWDNLLNDAIAMGDINGQTEPWGQRWFDLILGGSSAGVFDNER